jgi:hypothetical protein
LLPPPQSKPKRCTVNFLPLVYIRSQYLRQVEISIRCISMQATSVVVALATSISVQVQVQ